MNSKQILSIFLAVLMVGSVFAFANPAAAQATGEVNISLQPQNAEVTEGDVQTYDVVVEGPDNGISAYDMDIELTDASAATITDFEYNQEPGFPNSNIASDGSSITLSAGMQDNTYAAGEEATIATLTIEAAASGPASTDITFAAGAQVSDNDGTQYTVAGTSGASMSVVQTQPDFQITDVSPAQDLQVLTGSQVNVDATVENQGDASGTQDVVFNVDGAAADTQQVSLGVGASQTVTLSAQAPGQPTTVQWSVSTDDDQSTTFDLTTIDVPPEETSMEDLTVTPKDVLDTDVAGQPGNLLGVPFGVGPYPEEDALNFGEVTLTHDLAAEFNSTDEGETEEIEVDISPTTDQGFELVTDASAVETAFNNVPGLNVVNARASQSDVTVEYTMDNDGAAQISFDLTFSAEDPSDGLEESVSTSVEHTVEGPEGDSASDQYRLTSVGPEQFNQADLSEDYRGTENTPASSWNNQDARNVWAGTTLTFNGNSQATSIEIYNAVRDSDDQWTIDDSERVTQIGTQPGSTTSFDTSNLPDDSGQYFITFNEDNSQQFYLDLRNLDLEASPADDEITTENDLDIEVSSSDIGTTPAEGGVQAWFLEADDEDISDVIAVEEGSFDGDGTETLSVSPEGDLDGEGEYYAIVAHEESENFVITDTVTVTEPLDDEVTIESPRQVDEPYNRGDLVEVELSLEGTDTATLTLGDRAAGQNVEINITVEDTDEDGTVNFLLNTFQIGDGPVANDTIVNNDGVRIDGDDWGDKNHGVIDEVDEGTSVLNVDAHPSIAIGGGSNDAESRRVVIADGAYDLVASPGDTAWTADGAISTDNSIVRLAQRETGDLQAWNAPTPGDEAAIEDIEFVEGGDGLSIQDAIDEGLITPQDGNMAEEDILVLQIPSSGLEGVLADQAQENGDLDEFLNREEDHYVTEEFFNSGLIDLDTDQNFNQVQEIVQAAIADDDRNLPADETFGLNATLDLESEEVLAGTNERDDRRGNLDEYFVTITVNEDNINDIRAPENPLLIPAGSQEEDEIRTADVRPVRWNTTFTLLPDVDDSQAGSFPLNSFFRSGGDGTQLVQWNLQDDKVTLDDVQMDAAGQSRIFVPPQNNYTITGETPIAAGTSMTSQTQTASGEDPAFFYPNEFTVEYVEDGPNTIEFTEDFFDNDQIDEEENFAGAEFRMTIRRARLPGNLLEGADRRGLPGMVQSNAVNEHVFEDQESPGGAFVTVDTANISATSAAMVEIRNADGEVLGSSPLQNGANEDVTVTISDILDESQTLTSVIVDENGNEFSEGLSDAPISQSAEITVGDEAFYQVSNLQPASATAEPGDALTVSADVENVGDNSGEKTVELRLDGEMLDSQTVALDAGASETVEFDIEAPDAGDYTHSIWTEDSEQEGSLTVEEVAPANFELSNLDPASAEVEPGASITVSADIENTGDEGATQTVELRLDGEMVDSVDVTLEGGASDSVSFDISAPEEAGEYTHSIASEDTEVTGDLVVSEPEPQDDSSEDDSTQDDSTQDDTNTTEDDGSADDGGPGFGIVAALVALLGAALLAHRRRD